RRHHHACVRHLTGIAAVATDHADDFCAGGFGKLQRFHDIRRDVLFGIAAADRKYQHGVVVANAAAAQPVGECTGPAIIVDAGGELGHIVGRRIGFDPTTFSEVIDVVAAVTSAPANAE